MQKPNSFGLVYAVEVLRELAKYIEGQEDFYDLYLLTGAADTIEQYMDDNNITLLETENGE